MQHHSSDVNQNNQKWQLQQDLFEEHRRNQSHFSPSRHPRSRLLLIKCLWGRVIKRLTAANFLPEVKCECTAVVSLQSIVNFNLKYVSKCYKTQ